MSAIKILKLVSLLTFFIATSNTYAGSGDWSNKNSKDNSYKTNGFNKDNIFNKKNTFDYKNDKSKSKNKFNKKNKHKGNKGGKNKPTSVPIDGGLGFLLVGAAAFGVKKLRNNNEKNS